MLPTLRATSPAPTQRPSWKWAASPGGEETGAQKSKGTRGWTYDLWDCLLFKDQLCDSLPFLVAHLWAGDSLPEPRFPVKQH